MSKRSELRGVTSRDELGGFRRAQRQDSVYKTVAKDQLETAESEGWELHRENKNSLRMRKPRTKSDLLEARAWRVLDRMGFPHLSGPGGASVKIDGDDSKSPENQLDAVALDDEAAIVVECKSYQTYKKDSRFPEKLAKLAGIRGTFSRAVASSFPTDWPRSVGTVMVVWDLDVRETDRQRAEELGVLLLDEKELEYYEGLVKHIGPAARYQLLADVFRGKSIKGLSIRVPALRAKMGRLNCYTFSVRPDYLLKISYIAHRAKGKAIDVDAYQRMLSRSRLNSIRGYVDDGGIFPTNIVVNLEDRRDLRFDIGKQEADDKTGGVFGWLTLSPSYGSAWVIDGQHRLFAYSGHERAATSFLNVLAFEGLSPAKQTELFVNINSEQRKVPRSLLVELDATLKWEDDDEEKRVHAIISKAAMGLDVKGSPFDGRILLSDVRKTKQRCVSLAAISKALGKPGFFVVKKGGFKQYKPLWRADPTMCLRRTLAVLRGWFEPIAEEAEDWWVLGQDEGGGLAMNDGVTVCINVLRSVFDHLDGNGSLGELSDDELVERLTPYAIQLGRHLARMSIEEKRRFRSLRGGQGQDTATREAQAALRAQFSAFSPDGLDEWLERRKQNTNQRARTIIDRVEKKLQATVLRILKEEYDSDEKAWWYEGVPVAVRKKVKDRIEEAGGGLEEEAFDFLHYETIIKYRWPLLKPVFAEGAANVGKDKGTAWLRTINEWRNKVMHPSRRDYLGLDELEQLQGYETWMDEQINQFDDGS